MEAILQWLGNLFSSEIMIVFSIAALGYLLGSIHIKGLSLGTSGILIVALVFGHFGLTVSKTVQDLGLIISTITFLPAVVAADFITERMALAMRP